MSPAAVRHLVTAAIALSCGLVGATLAQRLPPPSAAPLRPPQDYRLVQFRERVDRMLAQAVRLTPAQERQLAVIDRNYTLDYNLTLADLHASNTELAAALARDMSLNDDAKAAIKEIQLNVGQMQTSTVGYIVDVRNMLTPEQRTIFDGRIIAEIM